MTDIDIATARTRLIQAGRILEGVGQGDMTRGHVSVRVPGNPGHFFMKAHSIGFNEITEENILTFDLESELVAGTARPHSERFIHSEIFQARPDINSVIHAHPEYAVALSSTGRPLRAWGQGGAIFHNALPVFTDTMDLIRSKDGGRAVAECLGGHHAVLMRSHGVAIAGHSIEQAVVLSIMLEEAAKIQMLAMAVGTDGWEFPEADILSLRDKLMRPDQFVVNFDFLARKHAGK